MIPITPSSTSKVYHFRLVFAYGIVACLWHVCGMFMRQSPVEIKSVLALGKTAIIRAIKTSQRTPDNERPPVGA